jgi:hypothetical protein
MFSSHRCTGLACLGAALESHALVHARFRLDATRNRNVVSDERLWLRAFGRKGHVGRPVLAVVLEGRASIEHEGRRTFLEPGVLATFPNKRDMVARQEGARFVGFFLEWDPGTLADAPCATHATTRLSVPDTHALRALVDGVAARPKTPGDAQGLFTAVVGALARAGAPVRAPADALLAEPVPAACHAIRTALDRSLSDLHARPMIVDLERSLGASPRHIQRLVVAFHARYGFDAGGWRDALRRRRMLVGTALMTAPGATTDLVARALGYGSPTAFCHAMADSRLPTPTAVPLFACEPAA